MDQHERPHTEWLGLTQLEGALIDIRVLADAGVKITWPVDDRQAALRDLAGDAARVADLPSFFHRILDWSEEDVSTGADLPQALRTLAGDQELLAITRAVRSDEASGALLLLVGETSALDLDAPPGERRGALTPHRRFERLLRETGVAMGLLTNGRHFRLIYAPHGDSTGSLTVCVADMLTPEGRPLLGAFHMLLGRERLLSGAPRERLHSLLRASREYRGEVTAALGVQLVSALGALLSGFEKADRRAKGSLLREVFPEPASHLSRGLATVLIRMVVVLFAEERGSLPVESPLYRDGYSLSHLHSMLREETSHDGDALEARHGAWSRIVALFRLLHDGARLADGALVPAYGSDLFDPDAFPFLEGRPLGAARQVEETLAPPEVSDSTVLRVLDRLRLLDGRPLSYRALEGEQIVGALGAMRGFTIQRAEDGSLHLGGLIEVRPHTPRRLTQPIVETALRPVLEQLGPRPAPEQILDLRVCDPAMGSGAFLVEVCRQLAEALAAAWRLAGAVPDLPEGDDAILLARRLVAQRCVHGVDRDPLAVTLARLSLWLLALGGGQPLSFVDHALRAGDSLVGLSVAQIESFSFDPARVHPGAEPARLELQRRLRGAESAWRLGDASEAFAAARLVGDVMVAACWGKTTSKARQTALDGLAGKVSSWLGTGAHAAELRGLADDLRDGDRRSSWLPVTPFHWELELPEVFQREPSRAGFDCVVGNPPFIGSRRIEEVYGKGYAAWLAGSFEGAAAGSDLAAYFLRRSFELLREGGTFGIVLPTSIAQGQTGRTGLGWICDHGGHLFDVQRSLPLPEAPSVLVAVIHGSRGLPVAPCRIDGREVPRITALLFHRGENRPPSELESNEGLCSLGGAAAPPGLDHVMVCFRIARHLAIDVVPAATPTTRQMVVFATADRAAFAVLQSTLHERWARLWGAPLRDDLNYAPSSCFDTFPFPQAERPERLSSVHPALEAAGRDYHDARAALVLDGERGLLRTYLRMHRPDERAAGIRRLRELHAALDRAVLDAYGWTDIQPAYDFRLQADGSLQYTWDDETHDEVIARLLELNRVAAEKEAARKMEAGPAKVRKKADRARRRKSRPAGPDAPEVRSGVETTGRRPEMLTRITTRDIEPMDLDAPLAPRLTLLAGDNGLGKTFLLDLCWNALTGTWAQRPVIPRRGDGVEPTIGYELSGEGSSHRREMRFDFTTQAWLGEASTDSQLVIYAHPDGAFDVWDPYRLRASQMEQPRPRGEWNRISLEPSEVWESLTAGGVVVCNGLLRDWTVWQFQKKQLFDLFQRVLAMLSPRPEYILRPGPSRRVTLDTYDIPTLSLPYGDVPVTHASSGMRRVLALAYMLVWTWYEHTEAARLQNTKPLDQLVLLVDEIDAHLHPTWQRVILPALFEVIPALERSLRAQVLVSTHAPLVLASAETLFDEERDRLLHFALREGKILVENLPWAKQGDAVNWLVSEAFGLAQARSREAERAIEAAEAFMRGAPTPPELSTREAIQAELERVLPGHDDFWPRWLVETGVVK